MRASESAYGGIWLITIPKSGSMYILHTLSEFLNLKPIGVACFPEVVTDPKLAKDVGRGVSICHAHTIANKKNIETLLSNGIDKCVVHARDPRQCILSWVYWLNEGRQLGADRYSNNQPDLPGDYYDLPVEEQITWQIENRLSFIVEMIDGWVKLSDIPEPPIDVLFTEFQNMTNDSEMFFREILGFYGINREGRISPSQAAVEEQAAKYHYRKGESEWSQVFSVEQQEKSFGLIPSRMLSKFGWGK